MAASQNYIVIHADYLDQEDGLEPGVTVTAEPGLAGQLNVTSIGEKVLASPIAVNESQLKVAA